MSSQDPAADAPDPTRVPLFYRQPVPLSSSAHSGWRLKDGDVAFAAETPYVPLVVGELAPASRACPIVFSASDAHPIAVLGLEHVNLFVEQGRWAEDAYVPAYVRRYPFAFIATSNPDGFVLAIDAGSDRVASGGEEGSPLFEDGQPSALTQQALAFCDAFQAEAAATRAFADALRAQDLLVDRRADATLPNGRKLGLEGFQVVDADRFRALPHDVVIDWHAKGYLSWISFHLASLDLFPALLARRVRRGSPEGPTVTEAAAPSGPAKSRKVS